MPITGPIPLPETGMDAFLKQLQIGKENRLNQDKLMQEALANEQLNQYRKGELGIKQDEFNLSKQKMPLSLELLRAQIENQKALASQRKNAATTLNGLTKANITRNQSVIQSVDNVSPLLDDLTKMEVPWNYKGVSLSPDKMATYTAKTAAVTDSLVAALGLPKTNESIELAKTMVQRHPLESLNSYRTRLGDLKKDLQERKKRSASSIKSGLFDDVNSSSSSSEDTNLHVDENGNLVESQ